MFYFGKYQLIWFFFNFFYFLYLIIQGMIDISKIFNTPKKFFFILNLFIKDKTVIIFAILINWWFNRLLLSLSTGNLLWMVCFRRFKFIFIGFIIHLRYFLYLVCKDLSVLVFKLLKLFLANGKLYLFLLSNLFFRSSL